MQFIKIPLIQSLYLSYKSFIRKNPDELPNFTLRTIAKISDVLGERILTV